jgi:hypothetical protein
MPTTPKAPKQDLEQVIEAGTSKDPNRADELLFGSERAVTSSREDAVCRQELRSEAMCAKRPGDRGPVVVRGSTPIPSVRLDCDLIGRGISDDDRHIRVVRRVRAALREAEPTLPKGH